VSDVKVSGLQEVSAMSSIVWDQWKRFG